MLIKSVLCRVLFDEGFSTDYNLYFSENLL